MSFRLDALSLKPHWQDKLIPSIHPSIHPQGDWRCWNLSSSLKSPVGFFDCGRKVEHWETTHTSYLKAQPGLDPQLFAKTQLIMGNIKLLCVRPDFRHELDQVQLSSVAVFKSQETRNRLGTFRCTAASSTQESASNLVTVMKNKLKTSDSKGCILFTL